MTWFRWWHKQTRILFKPKSPEIAVKWTSKLSLLYAFFGWNAFCFVVFKYGQENKAVTLTPEQREGLSPGQQAALERGDNKAKIVRLDGLRMVVFDAEAKPKTEPIDQAL